jgi:hypothetical protein
MILQLPAHACMRSLMACLQPYNDLHLLFEKLVYQPLLISQHHLSNMTLEVSTLYDLITFTPAPPIAVKDFMKVSEHFKLLKDTQYRLQPPPKSHYRNHETLSMVPLSDLACNPSLGLVLRSAIHKFGCNLV